MAKSSRKAEVAKPTSEESVAASDNDAMDVVASGDEGGEGSDVQSDAAEPAFNALRALNDRAGAFHAVHQRFAEMLPYLPAAIEAAEGELRQFPAEMLADLTR